MDVRLDAHSSGGLAPPTSDALESLPPVFRRDRRKNHFLLKLMQKDSKQTLLLRDKYTAETLADDF